MLRLDFEARHHALFVPREARQDAARALRHDRLAAALQIASLWPRRLLRRAHFRRPGRRRGVAARHHIEAVRGAHSRQRVGAGWRTSKENS